MGWIKRNLIFVVGIVVALGLLGTAGFYIYTSWARNSEVSEKLNGIYGTLKNLQQQKPAPGNDKVDNTKIANEQQQQVREWVVSSGKYFQPIAAIPPGKPVTSEAFASALRRTMDQLQHEADNNGVTLPPKYDFSFSAERLLVKFAAGSLEPLAVELGEVRAISGILFSTRINSLETIQRVRVSEDDANGPQGDFIDDRSVTNNLAVITPYVISFRCFTPELSRVVSAFATSSNGFLIKSINVQPAGTAATAGASGPAEGTLSTPQGFAPGGNPGAPAMSAGAGQPVAGKGGLQTVLKEQLLRVTLQLEIVKLLPKS